MTEHSRCEKSGHLREMKVSTPYKRGTYVGIGLVLGTFIGILLHKLALGMIFGFFIGAAMDAKKWREVQSENEHDDRDA